MRFIFLISFFSFALQVNAQDANPTEPAILDTIKYDVDTLEQVDTGEDLNLRETTINGQLVTVMITPSGDTLIMADLEDVSITSLRKFETDADYLKYLKFKRYAAKVYPYAKEAIKIFREMEYATQNMKRRQRKKYIKELEKELEVQFEEPLKKLTKLQGKIMIKMIEKETDETMFNLLKGIKGRLAAFSYHNMGKLYSYDLKEGYNYGDYEILDAVLEDFDISYRIEQDRLEELNKQK